MTTETKNIAVSRLNGIIEAGKDRAREGVEALQREYQLRKDVMVKPEALDVEFEEIATAVSPKSPDKNYDVERHYVMHPVIQGEKHNLTSFAEGQLYARAGIPQRFAETVLAHHEPDLLRFNFQKLLPKLSDDGLLIRDVAGTIKGVLSPAYKRIDASPLFEGYLKASLDAGYLPHKGEVTDTRAFISFIQPELHEIIEGEYVVLGHELKTSDYGNGGVELDLSITRLLCLNGLIGSDVMKRVHLGRRFDGFGEKSVIKLSGRTERLDTATIHSALRDAVKALPSHVEALEATLKENVTKNINVSQAVALLKKSGVKAAVAEKVKTLYETQLPVESVPQSPGAWRFANVLSLLANEAKGDEAKDLQAAAFDVLGMGKRAA